ncbi:MAG: hypothetical protein ACKPKO_50150, partial [Candidatus Fonsibacter sp.]
KWQSEEHIGMREAAEWSRHFADLEREMDVLLAELFGRQADLINQWIATHRYVSGREMADAGLAELIALEPLRRPFTIVVHGRPSRAFRRRFVVCRLYC